MIINATEERILAIALALAVLGLGGCGVRVTGPVLPAGQVEIRVDVKKISTGDFNKLDAFVGTLAEKYRKGYDGQSHSFHGSLNQGYVIHQYIPAHPVPSPEFEAAMQASLDGYLKTLGIDTRLVTLELRYPESPPAH